MAYYEILQSMGGRDFHVSGPFVADDVTYKGLSNGKRVEVRPTHLVGRSIVFDQGKDFFRTRAILTPVEGEQEIYLKHLKNDADTVTPEAEVPLTHLLKGIYNNVLKSEGVEDARVGLLRNIAYALLY